MESAHAVRHRHTDGDIIREPLIWGDDNFLFHFIGELCTSWVQFLQNLENLRLDFSTGDS